MSPEESREVYARRARSAATRRLVSLLAGSKFEFAPLSSSERVLQAINHQFDDIPGDKSLRDVVEAIEGLHLSGPVWLFLGDYGSTGAIIADAKAVLNRVDAIAEQEEEVIISAPGGISGIVFGRDDNAVYYCHTWR